MIEGRQDNGDDKIFLEQDNKRAEVKRRRLKVISRTMRWKERRAVIDFTIVNGKTAVRVFLNALFLLFYD